MSLPFGPPQQVSPLIRGVRFALLFAGIVYARTKQAMYNSMEASWREEEAKKKIIRDKEMVKLKARIAAEEKHAVRLLETGKLFEPDAFDTPAPPDTSAPPAGKSCPPK